MSQRFEQPFNRDRRAREALLEAMSEKYMTVAQIAKAAGKSSSTVMQMLEALEMDRCVYRGERKRAPNGNWLTTWSASGLAVPDTPTSTTDISDARQRDSIRGKCFDFGALMQAWPANGKPPPKTWGAW